jgi:hypothetical protein
MKRALQMTVLMSSLYLVSSSHQAKADAYCDAYIAGCYAGLAEWCEDTWYAGCSASNHSDKHCDCGS